MNRILCFGASNSSRSINVRLARHAAGLLSQVEIDLLDLNDFEMPIYGLDREEGEGIPERALRFRERVAEADGVVVSLAEHNGTYAVAFKNVMDWASRTEGKLWQGKPLCLLATSPGGRGARTVLDIALDRFPRMGAEITSSFSLPHFREHFDEAEGITSSELARQLAETMDSFQARLPLASSSIA